MKIKAGIFGILFVAMVAIFPHTVSATQVGTVDANNTQQQEQLDDPLYGRANGNIEEGFYEDTTNTFGITKRSALYGSRQVTSSYTQKTYTHATKYDGLTIHNGIDVSKYQKNIDWNQVKQSGIEFAFIRVAYRGASSGGLYTDATYAANIQNAVAAGVKVGVYVYSQAISPEEGIEEANYVLNLIKGYNVTMPVVIDYEYSSAAADGGRLFTANLSKETATATVNAFAKQVETGGYTPMIYANLDMLTRHMNSDNIPYPVWLAHYTTQTPYTGDYTAWQYSSSGAVPGITGDVDMNYWYGDLTSANPDSPNQSMFRMYNPNSGEHFYTANTEERMNLVNQGWTYEGTAWTAPKSSNSPVYRLYNPNAGDHFYTQSAEERDNLVKSGWKDEGIGWYSDDNKQVPLYREYNPNAQIGTHNYTPSTEEHGRLIGLGWKDEGLAWYGVNPS